jgi:hypothetical protein
MTKQEFEQELELMNDEDQLKANWLVDNYGLSYKEAFNSYEYVTFWKDVSLKDVAWELIEDGAFGEVSSRVFPYIDIDILTNDLGHYGYYEEAEGVYQYN